MVQTYRLLFETIEEAPSLDIEYKAEKMASGGDFEDKISFLSSPHAAISQILFKATLAEPTDGPAPD